MQYTFANGEIVEIIPISQFTIASMEIGIRRAVSTPPIPVAPGVGGALEPNPADPAYQRALAEHEREINQALTDALLGCTIAIAWDDAKRARLAALRQTIRDIAGVELDANDTVAYVKHCCVFDIATELQALVTVIREAGTPTPEEVQAHVETFRRNLQGTRRVQAPDAAQPHSNNGAVRDHERGALVGVD